MPPPNEKRIPLRLRAVRNPTDAQLVFWSLREGILQRMSPSEAALPAGKISTKTIARLKLLYRAALDRWWLQERAEAERVAKGRTQFIRAQLAEFFSKKSDNSSMMH